MATLWHSMVEHRMRYIRCHNKCSAAPPPLQVDATYSANPDLSGKREREKNHTHTRGKKKYLQDVLNVADKTHGVKTTCKWEVCRLLLFSSSSLFLLSFFKFANKLYRAAAV